MGEKYFYISFHQAHPGVPDLLFNHVGVLVLVLFYPLVVFNLCEGQSLAWLPFEYPPQKIHKFKGYTDGVFDLDIDYFVVDL